jgi:D-alanyl-D-alanine carboxypeptidase
LKRRYLAILLINAILLGGCQKSSDQFFAYQDYITSSKNDLGFNLSENEFFAKELVILDNEDSGYDDNLVTSKAAFLFDITNKKALYAKNPYERLYPASLTKLMTALIVFKRGELTDMVTISHNASNIPVEGAKVCGFREGDLVSLEDLLYCLLVYSGNDASIAIAEHLSGSEEAFVKLMNQEAQKLGAVHTNFVNSHGLHDDNHYTTAYDLYLIYNELLQYDTFIDIINKESFTSKYKDKFGNYKERTYKTTNLYLTGEKEVTEDITIVGGKTGLTSKAGNCLILLLKDGNDNQYVSLILKATNSNNLYTEMSKLFSLIIE